MNEELYIDTTILVEALLKTNSRRRRAKQRIAQSPGSSLPVYAIKEFKSGALSHFIWVHNKLAETGSLSETLEAIKKNWRKPYRVGTSLEALQVASEGVIGQHLKHAKTGSQGDKALADSMRFNIHVRIRKGWAERRKITTRVINELSCYSESTPYLDPETLLIENGEVSCTVEPTCACWKTLKESPENLGKLLKSIEAMNRPEDVRRRAALHQLKNTPKRTFCDPECRGLGDAYFALTCPKDHAILTSNPKDHRQLAGSLSIPVEDYVP